MPTNTFFTKLTEEQYDDIIKILKEEGVNLFDEITFTKYGKLVSHYEHYYGYNKPID